MRMWSWLPLIGLVTACGPMGNSLGLDGMYQGTRTLRYNGTYTRATFGGGTATTNITGQNDDDVGLTIEKAYETDAVLIGLDCPLPLTAKDGKLVLDDEVTCRDKTHTTATQGSASDTTDEVSTTTFRDLEVEEGKSTGKVTITASGSIKTTRTTDGTVTEDSNYTFDLEFDGERVAGE